MRATKPILALILLLSLGLRLGYSLSLDPLQPYDRAKGGDAWWYLEYSYRQVVDENMEPLSSAPLYLIFLGGVRVMLQSPSDETVMIFASEGGGLDIESVPGVPSAATVIVMRVLQALMSTATVYFVYRIGRGITHDERVGIIAAAVMSTSLAMIVSAAEIQTETTYLFFLTAALMLYIEVYARRYKNAILWLAVSGGLFGLATLTRAVLLLFPLGLLVHAVLVRLFYPTQKTQGRGVAPLRPAILRGTLVLLAVYTATCAIWTGYYYLRWSEVVIGAKGMTAFFYLGTQGDWQGPESTDAALGVTKTEPADDDYFIAGAGQTIAADPASYAVGRVRNLAEAYMQPYGTVAFSGESVKVLVSTWAREDRTLNGFIALLTADAFIPKLGIYLVHYGGIMLGVLGMWFSRAHWRTTLPIIGFLAYITLLHLVLLALPRYIFPTLPFWWCFAAVTVVRLLDAVPSRQQVPSRNTNQAIHVHGRDRSRPYD